METCIVSGCDGPRLPTQLMCRRHWFRVPRELRQAVWAAYRRAPGSSDHLASIVDAIEAVTIVRWDKGGDDGT